MKLSRVKTSPWVASLVMNLYRLLMITLVFSLLAVMWQVWLVPDYRGGEAYVSHTDHYKMSRIYPPEKPGSGGGVFYLVSSWPENQPLGIYMVPHDWGAGFKDIWFCKPVPPQGDKTPCYGFMVNTNPEAFPMIPLPPDLWHRLVAWAFFRLHPWQDEKLEERPMYP